MTHIVQTLLENYRSSPVAPPRAPRLCSFQCVKMVNLKNCRSLFQSTIRARRSESDRWKIGWTYYSISQLRILIIMWVWLMDYESWWLIVSYSVAHWCIRKDYWWSWSFKISQFITSWTSTSTSHNWKGNHSQGLLLQYDSYCMAHSKTFYKNSVESEKVISLNKGRLERGNKEQLTILTDFEKNISIFQG